MTTMRTLAEILEPQAWAALGTGDTLAYANRRKSSLRKAKAVLTALLEPDEGTVEATRLCTIRNSRKADPAHPFESPFAAAIQHIINEGEGT